MFAGLSGKTNSSDTDGALAVGMGFGNNVYSDSKSAEDLKSKIGVFGTLAVSLIAGASDIFEYSDDKVSFIAGISAAYTF